MADLPAHLRGLRGDVTVHQDAGQLADAAAAMLSRESADVCAAAGRFAVALAGGHTPAALFERLTVAPYREQIDWPVWAVYFGDERAVAPDDPASNFRMAKEKLLDHVPIDPQRVHRMPGDAPRLDVAADEYAVTLHGDLPEGPHHAPRLDCILLGLGENGHTASLFPGTPALTVTDRWVTRGLADYKPYERLTLTYPTINAAALVVFLVAGESKAAALRETAAGTTPAAGVNPVDGRLVWLIDAAAAGSG
jgi:6-phosphogluconolactonase